VSFTKKKIKNKNWEVACDFLWFFFRFFSHLRNEIGYKKAAASTLNQRNTKENKCDTLNLGSTSVSINIILI
jgi:hypothetical protein